MAYTKRLMASAILTVLTAGLLPASALALPGVQPSVVTVTSATPAFNPYQGEKAVISYEVRDATARNVQITIYKAIPNGLLLCNENNANYVTTLHQDGAPAITRPVGRYSAAWSGTYNSGLFVPAGLYCYNLRWENPYFGQTSLRQGQITVYPANGPVGGNINGAGNNDIPPANDPANGGAAAAGNGVASAGICPAAGMPQPDLCHYASQNWLELDRLPAQGGVVIHYNVNRSILTGLGLVIRDSSNNTVRQLFSTNGVVNVGSDPLGPGIWNGRYSNGSVVPVGTYRYVFTSGGRDIAGGAGFIDVRYSIPPMPPAHMDVSDVSVSPNPFNPETDRLAVLRFDLNYGANVNITVRRTNTNAFVTTLTNHYLNAGNNIPISWNGTYENGGLVSAGTYTLRIEARSDTYGADIVTTNLVVDRTPQARLDVRDVSVSPNPFNPETQNQATLRFTMNYGAGVNVAVRRTSDNTLIKTIANRYFNAGSDIPVTWNGTYENGGWVSEGSYTLTVAASNVSYGDDSASVYLNVTRTPRVEPFIVSHSVNPTSFTPSVGSNERATISYTLGKTVRNFSLIVRSQNGSEYGLRYATTLGSGNYSTAWSGLRTVNGQLVPAIAGEYTYTLAADYETAVTGRFTVLAETPRYTPVITNYTGDLMSFIPCTTSSSYPYNCGVNFSYAVNQDARLDLTILRGNTTVRRLIVSGYDNNALAGRNYTAFWNGKDGDGYTVPSDGATYTYLIEARNSNGIAQAVSGRFSVVNTITQPAMDVSNVFSDPASFNPTNQDTQLWFTLNQAANVTVTVTRTSTGESVATLKSDQYYSSGTHYVRWNGAYEGNGLVPEGTYTFRVSASSGYGSDYSSGNVIVTRTPNPPTLNVYNVYASPTSFDPRRQNTTLYFGLNYDANVTVTVRRTSDDYLVKTLSSGSLFYSGQNSVVWSGTDESGNYVNSNTYTFRVNATNAYYGSDSETTNITVTRQDVPPVLQISDSGANPNSFNPRAGQITKITFSANRNASVTVKVYRSYDGSFVRELPVYALGSNIYRAEWNGRNSNNYYVDTGDYKYVIYATADGYSANKAGFVAVAIDYYIRPPEGNCGNFTDVSSNYYLCPAIEFVKSRGIFAGYPNGTLGLDKVIQRAELLAVIQKAFGFYLDPYSPEADGSLGYRDLNNQTYEWYMPLVKTFARLGLMVGYPDGKMRPEKTMNTAELYLVFLRAAKKAPGGIAHYVLTDSIKRAPFLDTPVTKETKWYLKYAFFAKLNDLVTTERFYPTRGITRGQVIQLIYDTYRKGLITYGGSQLQ